MMKNISSKFRRGAASLMIGASLFGLAGCATTGGYAFADEVKNTNEKEYVVDSETALKYKIGSCIRENKVVFSGQTLPNGQYDLFIMNKEGGNLKNLTNSLDKWEWNPIWTKDGKIAYWEISNIDNQNPDSHAISYITSMKPIEKYYLIDADGNNKKEISEGTYNKLFK